MEINSFAIKVKKEPTAISLFAGVGGLCTNLQKSIKSGSVISANCETHLFGKNSMLLKT